MSLDSVHALSLFLPTLLWLIPLFHLIQHSTIPSSFSSIKLLFFPLSLTLSLSSTALSLPLAVRLSFLSLVPFFPLLVCVRGTGRFDPFPQKTFLPHNFFFISQHIFQKQNVSFFFRHHPSTQVATTTADPQPYLATKTTTLFTIARELAFKKFNETGPTQKVFRLLILPIQENQARFSSGEPTTGLSATGSTCDNTTPLQTTI